MRKLISILNPIYWTTAQEVGEAVNGYTLTGGVFRRETQVEFATGKKGQAWMCVWLRQRCYPHPYLMIGNVDNINIWKSDNYL